MTGLAQVRKITPPFTGRTHGKITVIVKYFSAIGVAVDTRENVYLVQEGNTGTIEQITPKGVKNTVCSGFGPDFVSVAVDTSEDVYTTDGTYLYYVAHKSAGGWRSPVKVGPSFSDGGVVGLAIDAQRNLYAADFSANTVTKIEPSGKAIAVGSGFNAPSDVAISVTCKASCPVYVSDRGHDAVKKVSPPFDGSTHGTITRVGYGFVSPLGVAARQSNVYVVDTGNVQVKEVIP